MEIVHTNNSITLKNAPDFCITHIFDCGQCFRWNKTETGSYIGVAKNRVIEVSCVHNNITLFNAKLQDFNEIWQNYFDLNRDYAEIKKQVSIDETMKRATAYGSGIRILKQDLWETTVSFIISSSNNIPRIKQIIERLCQSYGEKIEYNGKSYYTFPSYKRLDGVSEEELAPLRAGFRAKYIADAVKRANSGELDFDYIMSANEDDARKMLLGVKGIGNKVADCILLFGAGKFGVFPVDTWIDKAMRALYPEKCANVKDARRIGKDIFGQNCAAAQQYIYFYARENKLF